MQRRDRDVQVYRAAQRSEYLPDRADKTAILTRIKENAKGVGIVASVAENAETVPVKKAKVELFRSVCFLLDVLDQQAIAGLRVDYRLGALRGQGRGS